MEETKKFISLEEALRRGNDGKNQEIKRMFVGQHVYCNVGTLVEYCLNQCLESNTESPVTFDDLENYYSYPEYRGKYAEFDGGSREQLDEEIERLTDLLTDATEVGNDTEDYTEANAIEQEISELNDLETEPSEVYEWWAVSSFLYDKLKENGEVVVNTGSCKVWGRCTTGQAILLDYVITRICADMGILENQENAWL